MGPIGKDKKTGGFSACLPERAQWSLKGLDQTTIRSNLGVIQMSSVKQQLPAAALSLAAHPATRGASPAPADMPVKAVKDDRR